MLRHDDAQGTRKIGFTEFLGALDQLAHVKGVQKGTASGPARLIARLSVSRAACLPLWQHCCPEKKQKHAVSEGAKPCLPCLVPACRPGAEELMAQIARDCDAARDLLAQL